MPDYNDPQILHTAECSSCGWTFCDADVLNDNGECAECEQEREAEGRDADAFMAQLGKPDYFALAAGIAMAGSRRAAA